MNGCNPQKCCHPGFFSDHGAIGLCQLIVRSRGYSVEWCIVASGIRLTQQLPRMLFPASSGSVAPVGSKNQTGLGLCREHVIVWEWMVAIGQITLANTYDAPFVAVVIEIKELHRHSACGCVPHNA